MAKIKQSLVQKSLEESHPLSHKRTIKNKQMNLAFYAFVAGLLLYCTYFTMSRQKNIIKVI